MRDDRDAVLVPIKSFTTAKSRLRAHANDADVRSLTTQLAAGVIASCAPRPCVVACSDDEVEHFALGRGARVLRVSDDGLNEAVREAYALCATNFERVIIAHADIARPEGLGTYRFTAGVTIATDRHQRGTNVMALSTGLNFRFAYGDDSAIAHANEAARLGLELEVLRDTIWALDVDDPEDMAFLGK